jgi:DNA-binding response OmpR family regulator
MPPNIVVLADASDASGPRLSSILEHAGCQVHVFAFGKVVPTVIARSKPQAVVFSVGRQSENAYRLLAALRKTQVLKDTVMVGIFDKKESSSSTHLMDFDHRLEKPVQLDALLSAIGSRRQVRHRVLLVEDHEPLAKGTAFLMRHAGLEVWIASTGKDALEMADTVRPEIVLCDLRLPDMSGLDVVRELRASPGAMDALIAVHTAVDVASLDEFKSAADPLVDMYILKPLTMEKLDAVILGLRRTNEAAAGSRRKYVSWKMTNHRKKHRP